VYRTLNRNKKVKYKNFLHEVGRSWMSEVQNQSESNSDDLQLPEKQATPRGPKQDPPGRLSDDFRVHKLEKIVGWGGAKPTHIVFCVLYFIIADILVNFCKWVWIILMDSVHELVSLCSHGGVCEKFVSILD
jgi:hypothetical protein